MPEFRTLSIEDIIAAGAMPADLSSLPQAAFADVAWQLRQAVGWRKYWGTSSSETLDAAGVQALQNGDVFGTGVSTVNEVVRDGAPAEYFFFAYPIRLGGYDWFCCGARPDRPSVSPMISHVLINYEGDVPISYVVLRSPTKIAGSISFLIT